MQNTSDIENPLLWVVIYSYFSKGRNQNTKAPLMLCTGFYAHLKNQDSIRGLEFSVWTLINRMTILPSDWCQQKRTKDQNDITELIGTQSGVPGISASLLLGFREATAKARKTGQYEQQDRTKADCPSRTDPATLSLEHRVVCPGKSVFKDSHIKASGFQN